MSKPCIPLATGRLLSVLLVGILMMRVAMADSEGTLSIAKVSLPLKKDAKPACATLRADGKLMAFQMERPDRQGKLDIWFSQFENGQWSKPSNAGPKINTAAHEADAKLSVDGSRMVFIRSNDFSKYSEVYISHFRHGSWSAPDLIGPPVSSSSTTTFGVVLSADERRLYYSSNREGGHGGQDFYYSDRIGDGWSKWSEPVNLGPIVNTKENEVDLAVSRDQKVIVFPAKRPESLNDSVDLYITRKVDDEWTAPKNLGPRVNTPGTDTCPWLGYDGQTLYVNTDWDHLISGEKDVTAIWLFRYSKGYR